MKTTLYSSLISSLIYSTQQTTEWLSIWSVVVTFGSVHLLTRFSLNPMCIKHTSFIKFSFCLRIYCNYSLCPLQLKIESVLGKLKISDYINTTLYLSLYSSLVEATLHWKLKMTGQWWWSLAQCTMWRDFFLILLCIKHLPFVRSLFSH